MHLTLPKIGVFSHLLFWFYLLCCGTYGNPLVCLDHFKCELGVEKTTVACSDPGIDVVPLCLNPSLVSLTLQNTRIHTLYLTSFRYYADLKYVNLSKNKISKIEKKTFEYQHVLEELHLDYNTLVQLDVETFFGLKNLTVLSLANNLLEEISDGVLHSLTSLQQLDLSHNRITAISDTVFDGLDKLVTLSLSQNKFISIPKASFLLVPHLSQISLGGNPFERIEGSDFEALKSLDSLDLASTDLKNDLSTQTFHYIGGLRSLKLDDCQLPAIPTSALNALPQLEELYLSRNKFSDIPKDAFKGNRKLTSISVTGCPQLERLATDAFASNLNLKRIDLSRNPNLTYLPPGEFKFLTQLSYLDLHGNGLQYIPSDLAPWEEVNTWYIHYNPIVCNCSSAWLRKLLIEVNRTTVSVKCASPSQLHGKSLEYTEISDLLCGLDPTTQGIVIAFSICSLFLIIVGVVVFLLYRHRDPCVRSLLKGRKWDRNGSHSGHRSYDSDYPCIKPVPVTEL